MGTPVFQGNHGSGFMGHGIDGNGIRQVPVEMGWGVGTGKSGDVLYVPLSALLNGQYQLGTYIQSEIPITVDYTLANPANACDPDPLVQDMVNWDGAQAIPVGTITKALTPIYTVLRVTFGGDGSFFLGLR